MSMTLRVVIPPHPLIGHWLSILRSISTPPAIYATGLEQLGKWLTYEALRDWLPHKEEEIITSNDKTVGTLIDPRIPIFTIPNLPGGLELWQGAREIIPNATLCLGGVPNAIEENSGRIIYLDQIRDGEELLENLKLLKEQAIEERRIRVITALASNEALKDIGEIFSALTIYAACIDPYISDKNEIKPGIGNPTDRLNTRIADRH